MFSLFSSVDGERGIRNLTLIINSSDDYHHFLPCFQIPSCQAASLSGVTVLTVTLFSDAPPRRLRDCDELSAMLLNKSYAIFLTEKIIDDAT